MAVTRSATDSGGSFLSRFGPLQFLLLLLLVLTALFWRSCEPGLIHFSNDSPLGAQSKANQTRPDIFSGCWHDLNSVGNSEGSAVPSLSQGLQWALKPVGHSKFYAPIALLLLGVCVAFCFRQLGLSWLASALGGLAAMLNSSFFSVACWGIAGHTICVATSFLAIGLLARPEGVRGWIKAALAGMAVGMGVMEGADLAALFSLLVASFAAWQIFAEADGSPICRVLPGVTRLALVTACAAFFAAAAVYTLVQTAIVGVAGTQQDTRTKAERWDFATQWSLPKVETLQFAVPGLFGYRMDTPEGGNYWGAIGRDPNWDRYFAAGSPGEPPQGYMRFTGGGIYSGILVLLVAAWAAAQAFRGKESAFPLAQRRWIWFWCGVAGVSLLLSWGRFAPFYQFLYVLPYFSTIRSPAKFTYFVNFALVVLFAYGLNGLYLRYLQPALTTTLGPLAQISAWIKRSRGFDRRWAVGCLVAFGASALGFLLYASSRKTLVEHLGQVQLGGDIAEQIAGFSIREAGLSVLLLAVAVTLVLLVLSGWFAGRRAKVAMLILGGFLLLDMGRANLPWVLYVDYPFKYATNPVLEFLKVKPYEQRVCMLPFPMPQQLSLVGDLYRIEWAQHHFQRENIQSLDLVQMPRMPEDMAAFELAWRTNGNAGLLRRWELTNTRYIIGAVPFAEGLNAQVDPKHRFSVKLPFDIRAKPGIEQARRLEELNAISSTNGPYAVLEFSGALPRAKLYSNWTVNTNDAAVLARLFSPSFDPQQEVIVDGGVNPPAAATTTSPGTVEFASYAPKRIVLKADAKTLAILLLNDRFDPNWSVTVDGQPAPLLRANFFMRGVLLQPGQHLVEFTFHLSTKPLVVSLLAEVVALLLCGLLFFLKPTEPNPATAPGAKAVKPTNA